MKTLSILICTLPEQATKLKRLNNIILPQIERYPNSVSVHYNDAGRSMPTGTKRNLLLSQSFSDYFCFIDNDDIVSSHYVSSIMNAILEEPDVVTFCGWMTTNGANRQDFTIKLGSDYITKDNHHYRWPNHLAVMRKDKVRHIHFPDVWQQEDYQWSKKIHDARLLKTEVHIPLNLYHYDFETKPIQRQSIAERRKLRR